MKLLTTVGIGIVAFGIILSLVWQSYTGPVNRSDTSKVAFSVSKDQTVRDIASNLQQAHLIRNIDGFLLEVKLNNLGNSIQVGDFELSPSMSSKDIATTLTKAPADIWITIPEGKRAEEVDAILQAHFPQTYRAGWKTELEANEGYLFPDTYAFHKDATIETIITTMRDNFEQKYASVAKPSSFTKPQLVTFASIVEREGRTPQEMMLIASVIKNRLDIGMKLDVDATVQYAVGYDPATKRWWKENLTADDLAIDSPFNGYTHNTLPPHPICNPGLNSLKAVFNIPQTDYLYYYTDPKGVTHFEANFEQHNADIQRYGG